MKKSPDSLAIAYSVQRQSKKKMSTGGMVADDTAEHYDSIADAILAKKRKASMDTDATNHEDPNMFDELDEDAVGYPTLDEPSSQPMDSNEMGSNDENEVDPQQDDTVSAIRRKMKAKKS